MKSAILLVLILSATAASALEGWRKSMSDIEAIPLPGIKAELVNHSEAGTEVRVTNESGGGLLYHGYYAARPVLYFEEMRDGQWVETTWDWCGTSLMPFIIKKGHSALFAIPKYRSGQFRVYTILYSLETAKSYLEQLYASPE